MAQGAGLDPCGILLPLSGQGAEQHDRQAKGSGSRFFWAQRVQVAVSYPAELAGGRNYW